MKQKTHKGLSKRVKISGRKKAMTRKQGQDHFNSRESGKTTKNKRRDRSLEQTEKTMLTRLLPYMRTSSK